MANKDEKGGRVHIKGVDGNNCKDVKVGFRDGSRGAYDIPVDYCLKREKLKNVNIDVEKVSFLSDRIPPF